MNSRSFPGSFQIIMFLFCVIFCNYAYSEGTSTSDRFAAYRQMYAENGTSVQTGTSNASPAASPNGTQAGTSSDGIRTESPAAAPVPAFNFFPSAGGNTSFGTAAAPELTVSAKITKLPGIARGKTEDGMLVISASIPEGFKIYSITQAGGGPFPTKLNLPAAVQPTAAPAAVPAPSAEKDEEVWGDIVIESHKHSVEWNIPFRWTDPEKVPAQLSGNVEAQMCDANSCLPPKKFAFSATVSAPDSVSVPAPAAAEFPDVAEEKPIPAASNAAVPGMNESENERIIVPAKKESRNPLKPAEDSGKNAENSEVNHVPAEPLPLSASENSEESLPNEILAESQNYLKNGEIKEQGGRENDARNEETAADAAYDSVSDEEITPSSYSSSLSSRNAAENLPSDASSSSNGKSLAILLLMAYLGGLILNLMPCVLPVIAPKLHSFMRQSGEARGRVFLLNVSYTLGLLTVLWLLAALSRIADLTAFLRNTLPESLAQHLPDMQNMGWGQQFTYPAFVIFMIALVFIMGLSFLGVWEIPIPGMISGGKLGKMQRKEGFLGAYCMGILTTLLATPCVGPYLGTVFGWVVTQSVAMSFLVFTVIGLGLGTPYLLIGAFPMLIRFLPKPGEWMETFKEVMGFFFMGTVVWLFYILSPKYVVPTLGLLTALWFACWLIGKTTLSGASREKVFLAWAAGIITAALVGFFLFSLDLTPTQIQNAEGSSSEENSDEIPWKAFSNDAVEAARAKNHVVFIDFTARWCATCQTNSKFAIQTAKVNEFIRRNDIVPLLADWTQPSEEIEKYLRSMGRSSIPLIVIWIPGQEQPVLLDGLITESKLLQTLEFAVQKE